MPAIFITCPATGKAVDTGLFLDKATFENPATTLEHNTLLCPHCGRQHTWGKKEAYAEGEQPRTEQ